MSATITDLPDGRVLVKCDTCRTQMPTPFREVAQKMARTHVCPISALRAMRARKGKWV